MKRPLLIAFVIVGSLSIVCAIGGWLVWRSTDMGQAAAQLDQAVADARAAGLPWVAADLAQRPPVKDGENAAPFIRQAKALIDGDPKVGQALTDLAEAQRQSDDASLRVALDKLKPLLRVTRLAADKPRCDFHRDWDKGSWLAFPEFAKEMRCAKVLSAAAVREAAAGDAPAALEDLERVGAIGRHAGADPVLIGMLVDVDCDEIAMRAAERIAELWHTDAGRLGRLRATLGRMGPEPDLKYALRGEEYVGLSLFRNVVSLRQFMAIVNQSSGMRSDAASQEELREPKTLVRSGVPRTWFGRIMLCRNLQMWVRIRKRTADVTDPVKISKILDVVGEEEQHMGWSHMANQVLMPVFSQSGVSVVKLKATRLCTEGLAAVLGFKARTGRYPATLAEAGVRDVDPFDGKPLKLRVSRYDCRVYSVGPDGEDNDGIRQSEMPQGANREKGWDVVASYPAYVPPRTGAAPSGASSGT